VSRLLERIRHHELESIDAFFGKGLHFVRRRRAADPAFRRFVVNACAWPLRQSVRPHPRSAPAPALPPSGKATAVWPAPQGPSPRPACPPARRPAPERFRARRAGQPVDGMVFADRTLDEISRNLRLRVVLRSKPALETMVLRAAQVEHLHDVSSPSKAIVSAKRNFVNGRANFFCSHDVCPWRGALCKGGRGMAAITRLSGILRC